MSLGWALPLANTWCPSRAEAAWRLYRPSWVELGMADMLCRRRPVRRGATGRVAGMRGGEGGHCSAAILSAVDSASAGVTGRYTAVGRLPAAVAAVSDGGDATYCIVLSSACSTGRSWSAPGVDAEAALAELVDMLASGRSTALVLGVSAVVLTASPVHNTGLNMAVPLKEPVHGRHLFEVRDAD